MSRKAMLDAKRKSSEFATRRQEERNEIRKKLQSLPENTVINRYILRDNKLVHLRKSEYKTLLDEKAIKFAEYKQKEPAVETSVESAVEASIEKHEE